MNNKTCRQSFKEVSKCGIRRNKIYHWACNFNSLDTSILIKYQRFSLFTFFFKLLYEKQAPGRWAWSEGSSLL